MPQKKKKRRNYNGRTVTWTRSPADEVFESHEGTHGPAILEGVVVQTILQIQRTDGRIVRVDATRVRVIG